MSKKTTQIIFRTTEKQKEFLKKQAEKEKRSVTTIIHTALETAYPKYKADADNGGGN